MKNGEKMKKILSLLFVLSFLLIGCGKKGDPYPKKPSLKSANLEKIVRDFLKNG